MTKTHTSAHSPLLVKGSEDILKAAVATTHHLFIKTLHTHWNAVGSRFLTLHEFTEKQYKVMLTHMDLLAEQLRTLGHQVPTDHASLIENSALTDDHAKIYAADKLCYHLASSHDSAVIAFKSYIERIQEKDPLTADLLTDLAREHSKLNWIYRSIVE